MTPMSLVSSPFLIREAQEFPLTPYRLLCIGKTPLVTATRRLIFDLIRFKVPYRHIKYILVTAGKSIEQAQILKLKIGLSRLNSLIS